MLSFIYNTLIFILLCMKDGLEYISFICIALCFSELKEIRETLSFICNYTDFVYVTGEMKHNERFFINKPLKMLSYGSSENFCTTRQLIVWFRNFPVNHTTRHRDQQNFYCDQRNFCCAQQNFFSIGCDEASQASQSFFLLETKKSRHMLQNI
jgi:hypothetical protein